MNAPTSSQRHFARVSFHAPVSLHLTQQQLPVELLDIALKGALVRLSQPIALVLGEPARLVLELGAGAESIELQGRVAHLEGDQVGLACEHIELASLTRLRRLIELNTGDADAMDRELSLLFQRRTP